MLVLLTLFVFYSLADGAAAIVAAFRAIRSGDPFSLLLVEGIVDILAGLAALFVVRVEWLLVTGSILSVVVGLFVIWAPLAGVIVSARWIATYTLLLESRWCTWIQTASLVARNHSVALTIDI